MSATRNAHRSGRLRLGLALLLAFGAAALVPASADATDWTKLRALNITHQGGEDEAPSATMYAFERSMKLGSDMLEVDVNATKDDKLAIIHDGTVDRTTNGTGRVADKTMAEMKRLDAAHWFVPGAGAPHDAPRGHYVLRGVRTGEKKPPVGYRRGDFRPLELDELIRTYPDVPINIEIKGGAEEDPGSYIHVAEVLADYLNELGRTDGIIVASFNDAALARFHQLAPDIDTAPGLARTAAYVLTGAPPPPSTAAFQVPPEFEGIEVVNQDFVDRAHSDGYGVHVWTINDEPRMNELFDLDVDGIMTAEPMRLEKVMCERGERRPPLPASSPGRHCSRRVSIACEVEPTKLRRKKRRVTVTLTRRDPFGSRCAGKLTLSTQGKRGKPKGRKGKRNARFDFGWAATGEDTSGERTVVKLRISKRMQKRIKRHRKAKLRIVPFDGFATKAKLRAR